MGAMSVATLTVSLPEIPNLGDHAISGKAIVPAVEILDFLLRVLDDKGVRLGDPLAMRDAVFPRFLPADDIPRARFEVTLEDAPSSGGGIRATLASRIVLPTGIERQRTHAAVTFGGDPAPMAPPPAETGPEFEVAAERVYRQLIPFGPRYCNLRNTVRLARDAAWGQVASPAPPRPNLSRAGCPYLFDSAMHLACVWGQRYAGMVAYPTGFLSRTVRLPTAHGERRCTVAPRSVGPRALVVDLWLTDEDGQVCDAAGGLMMAPVATGAPPPAWIVVPQLLEVSA
jgi:hypothetical protein